MVKTIRGLTGVPRFYAALNRLVRTNQALLASSLRFLQDGDAAVLDFHNKCYLLRRDLYLRHSAPAVRQQGPRARRRRRLHEYRYTRYDSDGSYSDASYGGGVVRARVCPAAAAAEPLSDVAVHIAAGNGPGARGWHSSNAAAKWPDSSHESPQAPR